MAEEKVNYKTRNLLMAGAVAAAILSTVIFVSFGGGSEITDEESSQKVTEFNETLPSSKVEAVTDDKLKAMQLEQARLENAKREGLEGSSFGLLDGSTEQSIGMDVKSQLDQAEEQLRQKQGENEKELERLNKSREELETAKRRLMSEGNGKTSSAASQNSNSGVGSSRRTIDLEAQRLANKKKAYKQLQEKFGKERYPDLDDDMNPIVQSAPVKSETKAEPPSPVTKKKTFNTLGASKGVIGHDIRAVVHGTHKNLTANSQVKLRLLDPMVVDGVTIPRNAFVYGKVSFGGGRVQINIDNVNYQDNVLPFRGEIYDQDGSRGIYVPDNAISDATKEAGGNTASGAQTGVTIQRTGSLVQSGINGVNSGINAMKNAVQKKATENKVSISANYKVTIREKKN
ncbi:MAG: conjugative transposon protein TraM [Bacilli bacterium]|nr:conjugative transposon protein TraM [Bacilli bacterium]